jgi:hypothetical protein
LNSSGLVMFKMTRKIIFFLASLWWGWTTLIDFIVVPTAFRTINDFFNAGELGVALFSKLNLLEILVGLFLFLLSLILFNQTPTKKIKALIILITCAWLLSLFFYVFLTPKISELSRWWKESDLLGTVGTHGIADIQQHHQFYHGLYVWLDSFKLFILSCIIGLLIFGKENQSERT